MYKVKMINGDTFDIPKDKSTEFEQFVESPTNTIFRFKENDTLRLLFKNGMSSADKVEVKGGSLLFRSPATEEMDVSIFGEFHTFSVTAEQKSRLMKWQGELTADNFNPNKKETDWIIGAIIEHMPPSRRSSYHKEDLVAAAEYYPVYSNRIDDNASRFK
jgi:hypothetical protein